MQNTFNSQNAIILKMRKYLNTIYLNIAHIKVRYHSYRHEHFLINYLRIYKIKY